MWVWEEWEEMLLGLSAWRRMRGSEIWIRPDFEM